jgi:hypothetical protein
MSLEPSYKQDLALADLLDRALNKGVVIWGEATISLAGVDLVFVGLKVLVASMEAAQRMRSSRLGEVSTFEEE